jgi:hypothetical protein
LEWIKRSSTAKSQELFNKGQNGLQLTVIAAQSIANTTFPLTFGGAGSAQAFYDEFALYDEALPSCEIGDHYTTATGGPYIGC